MPFRSSEDVHKVKVSHPQARLTTLEEARKLAKEGRAKETKDHISVEEKFSEL